MRGKITSRYARQFAGDFLIGIAVFLAVLALACFDHHSALSAPVFKIRTEPQVQQTPVTPANAKSGSLLIAGSNGAEGPSFVKTRHVSSDIDISVNGTVARVVVIQNFANDTGAGGRGIYAFPLPVEAAIDSFAISAGDRRIQGKIVGYELGERSLKIANSAGRFLATPAQAPSDATSISIDKISAGDDITVRIEYVQTLQTHTGSTRLEFPLMRNFRQHGAHKPQSASLDMQSQAAFAKNHSRSQDAQISLRIWLNAGFPIDKILSPTHAISVRRTGDSTAVLNLAHALVPTDRNFELIWQSTLPDAIGLAAFKETNSAGSHLLAMLRAGDVSPGAGDQARELVFVIDTSGSMSGHSLVQLKDGLRTALTKLTPRDRFNMIQFNSRSEQLFQTAKLLTPESLAEALNFVASLEARGGTEALPALDAALADIAKEKDQNVRQIVFVTDGEIAGASEFLSHIAQRRGRSRLFTVGIGPDISAAVMRRAAEIGRGKFVHISNRYAVNKEMNVLLDQLRRPVVTDLRLEWPNGVRADTWPNPLPDLYADETLVVSTQLSAIKGDLKITGNLAGQPWSKTLSLANATDAQGVSRYWARDKIASLQARRYSGQSQIDVNSAIEAFALEHGVVSSRTMLVGMDVSRALAEDQPLASEELPIELPSAWVHDGISRQAPEEAGVDRARTIDGPTEAADISLLTSSVTGPASGLSGQPKLKIAVRTGGFGSSLSGSDTQLVTNNSQTWALSIMAIIFALMTALTLGLWRHLRHAVQPGRTGRRAG